MWGGGLYSQSHAEHRSWAETQLLSVWAAVRRRAGSAPCAHALGAAGAAVGARRVLLALADARVLDRAQGGDLRKQRGRRPSAQAAMASVQGVARAYPACRWKGTAAPPDDCSSSCSAAILLMALPCPGVCRCAHGSHSWARVLSYNPTHAQARCGRWGWKPTAQRPRTTRYYCARRRWPKQ